MLTKRVYLVICLLLAASMLLAACGADPTATTIPAATATTAPVAVATDTAAPVAVATDTTAPVAVATDTPAAAAGTGKIAILLPDTKTARYESQDLPQFKAELAAKGYDVSQVLYSNANADSSAQQQQAEAAITNGAKVLVLDPVDGVAAASIADAAKAAGVPVISYDRLITGTASLSYYISFDNAKVGQLQAESLLTALSGKTNPTIVMINGSPTDNNATLFKAGAHSVLDGKVTIAKEYDTPDWSPDNAQNEMQQALTALGNKVDGVYAANDGTASGAIAAMKAAGVNPLPPVTGQDAEVAGIQRILIGEQYMTVYKALKAEAVAAADLALTLLNGGTPDATTINGTVNNGKSDVPSVLLVPVAVTKANINDTVIKDGFWKPADICTGDFAAACTAAGIGGAGTGTGNTGGTPTGKIAILLPDTKTARYESQDLPQFKAELAAKGYDVSQVLYSNANADSSAQQQQAEAAITNGAKVLVLDPVDGVAAASIADAAKAAGVPVISYDRLITGTASLSYYISFDNAKVGQLQAESLLTALSGKTNPTIVMINGSPTDNNATLFKAGAHSVLDGKVTIAKEYDTPDWSPDNAQNEMQQALTALGNKVDGVYAANDGTASGAIAAMKAAGVNPLPPVTGQDAEVAGIQRILIGEQYMTVYKALKAEAVAAADLALVLLSGGTPDATMINGKVNNGKSDVPSVLLVPVAVTKANINDTVIKDGFWKPADICTGDFAAACTAAGIGGSGGNTGSAPTGKIAILLPDTKTARYESQDLPQFKAELAAKGYDVSQVLYSNANADSSAQQQQAEAAITNGAKVLVLDPVDGVAAASIADAAKAAGVPVISYDRLITGTASLSYYISFDNAKVGQLQAESLLTALSGKTNPTIVMINGSPTDNNATLFKAGAHSVLDGKVTIAKEYDTPDWSPDNAQNEMQQALTALGNKVDGVYAANDGTASGAIAAMKAAGVNPLPPVTGQDAEVAGIQRILIGEQYMTVYKALKAEAVAAADLALVLLSGGTPDATMINGKVNNGKSDVPSVLLVPVAVTKANINDTVIKDGFWKPADICTGDFAAACTAAGIK